ncbi:MAG: glycosyltransferase family 9 protein [Bacteriovoracaceae bacterium]|nr:glycosyltransferase family 9 protein [Bacteriovoracaceae bacterium]
MRGPTQNILIIQTAFIGDVILATSFISLVKEKYPNSSIHFVLRDGNEGLLKNNPLVDRVWVWNKKSNKNKNLWNMIKELRNYHFEYVFTLQRFFSTGLITLMMKANHKIAFDKNSLSIFFTKEN